MDDAAVFRWLQAHAQQVTAGTPLQIIQPGPFTQTTGPHLHIGHHGSVTTFKTEGLTAAGTGKYPIVDIAAVPLVPPSGHPNSSNSHPTAVSADHQGVASMSGHPDGGGHVSAGDNNGVKILNRDLLKSLQPDGGTPQPPPSKTWWHTLVAAHGHDRPDAGVPHAAPGTPGSTLRTDPASRPDGGQPHSQNGSSHGPSGPPAPGVHPFHLAISQTMQSSAPHQSGNQGHLGLANAAAPAQPSPVHTGRSSDGHSHQPAKASVLSIHHLPLPAHAANGSHGAPAPVLDTHMAQPLSMQAHHSVAAAHQGASFGHAAPSAGVQSGPHPPTISQPAQPSAGHHPQPGQPGVPSGQHLTAQHMGTASHGAAGHHAPAHAGVATQHSAAAPQNMHHSSGHGSHNQTGATLSAHHLPASAHSPTTHGSHGSADEIPAVPLVSGHGAHKGAAAQTGGHGHGPAHAAPAMQHSHPHPHGSQHPAGHMPPPSQPGALGPQHLPQSPHAPHGGHASHPPSSVTHSAQHSAAQHHLGAVNHGASHGHAHMHGGHH
jgi:hypothetical protein